MLEDFLPHNYLPRSLESNRLTIRQWRMSDIDEHEELFQSSYEKHLSPWLPPQEEAKTLSERKRQLHDRVLAMLDKWEEGSDYRFLIVRNQDKRIVGQLGITGIVRNVNQSAFIGYWIGRDYLKNGYATEATVMAFHYAFEFLRLHRISLWISPENPASLQIAKKLGLRHEGCVKSALYLGGRWQDTDVYTILSEEWTVRKDELMKTFCKAL
jgi:[ribosomal protein S5]-alanine N-acetyltransferase